MEEKRKKPQERRRLIASVFKAIPNYTRSGFIQLEKKIQDQNATISLQINWIRVPKKEEKEEKKFKRKEKVKEVEENHMGENKRKTTF